ncbi:MAG: twin-arginine translocation signal domain-containing protein, partial [Planctomycetales bacterium]|nr:twin-arginine translocation signal domain-containing protein [Planctomycetales bacterium]
MDRRDFLATSALGAGIIVTGPLLTQSTADAKGATRQDCDTFVYG